MEKEKKKKKLKWQVKLFLLILFIILYSFLIGPKFIFTKDYKITSNKINDDLHGIKILHFSDLNYGSTTNKNMVKELVNKINSAKPDIVIFTGNLISKDYDITEEETNYIKNKFQKINSTYGKFYVAGKNDKENANLILNNSEFYNLNETEQIIYPTVTSKILLIGKDKTKQYFESNEIKPEFKILVLHNPDSLDEFLDYDFDMALAGSTLNGQINIYKLKDLFIKSKYKNNYELVKNTKLFINPGIGTNKIKSRLFNHPTIYLYRLNKAS